MDLPKRPSLLGLFFLTLVQRADAEMGVMVIGSRREVCSAQAPGRYRNRFPFRYGTRIWLDEFDAKETAGLNHHTFKG
jgi:hypothetical protein